MYILYHKPTRNTNPCPAKLYKCPLQKNINLLEEGIGFVNRKGFLKVEEPSDDEKRNLANAIINRGNLHKSLFQKAEEIMDEMGVVDKEHRDMIHQLIRVRFKNKENDENKLRKFIQANSGALE